MNVATPTADQVVDTIGESVVNKPTSCLGFLFLMTSFGYMLPWTSLGSLISYYKETYGADFYVLIYFCYYLPGLPISIFQHCFGEAIDGRFGSFRAYLLRGILFFSALITVLLLMINCDNKIVIYMLFMMLGVCGWACHGTASQLASMHSPEIIAMLQTGFRCPEIFTIVVVAALHIGRSSDMSSVNDLFILTAIAVLSGMIAWICACLSRESRECFEAKDIRLNNVDVAEVAPLLVEARAERSVVGHAKSIQSANDSTLWLDDDDFDSEVGVVAVEYDTSESLPDDFVAKKTKSGDTSCFDAMSNASKGQNSNGEDDDLFKQYRPRKNQRVAKANYGSNKPLIGDKFMSADVPVQPIWMLCGALIITIFCSIFQAAFFAYVSSSHGWEIEQILYFTRLFSDLVGRPLTRMTRPSFMKVSWPVWLVGYHNRFCYPADELFVIGCINNAHWTYGNIFHVYYDSGFPQVKRIRFF
jgi:hypothetical protein